MIIKVIYSCGVCFDYPSSQIHTRMHINMNKCTPSACVISVCLMHATSEC